MGTLLSLREILRGKAKAPAAGLGLDEKNSMIELSHARAPAGSMESNSIASA
jgi:hypothetical protein